MSLSGTKSDTEFHHVIPQANGGTNGKIVPLCNNHHDEVHKVANEILTSLKRDGKQSLDAKNPDHLRIISPQTTLDYYIRPIVISTLAVQTDPNKRSALNLIMTGQETRLLDQAKKVFNCKSRSAVVKLALAQLYAKAGLTNQN
jgi:hypothetical protein